MIPRAEFLARRKSDMTQTTVGVGLQTMNFLRYGPIVTILR